MTRTTLPAKGSDKSAVLDRLQSMVKGDIPLEHARFNLLTPYADDRFFDVGVQAMHYFAHYNAMFARIIPSVGKVIEDLGMQPGTLWFDDPVRAKARSFQGA